VFTQTEKNNIFPMIEIISPYYSPSVFYYSCKPGLNPGKVRIPETKRPTDSAEDPCHCTEKCARDDFDEMS
jgi:hypothetical protein